MSPESVEIETIVDYNRSHSSAAIGAGNTHSKDRCVYDRTIFQNCLVNFACRNILPLPAISVAYPIDKVVKARFIQRHQVASPKPSVTGGEHIAQDLLFCFGRISVTLKAAAAVRCRSDPTNGLTYFAPLTRNAKASFGTLRNAGLGIHTNNLRRKAISQKRWNSANRAGLSLHVVKRKITFGRRIKFEYFRNPKACLKGFPDIAT